MFVSSETFSHFILKSSVLSDIRLNYETPNPDETLQKDLIFQNYYRDNGHHVMNATMRTEKNIKRNV